MALETVPAPHVLNSRPIYIHGLMGGGTGILWNVITSHPDCLGPRFETNEVFRFGAVNLTKDLARRRSHLVRNNCELVRLSLHFRLNPFVFRHFDMARTSPRSISLQNDLSLRQAVDQRLFDLKVDHGVNPGLDAENLKAPAVPYTKSEIENTRLVAKNLEGLCFLRHFFKSMHPDAKFVSLVRNGLASCESRLRHGRSRSAREAGIAYRALVGEMLLAQEDKDHLLIRYEDLVQFPRKVIKNLYAFLELPLAPNQMFRMSVREFLGREGTWLRGQPIQSGKQWFTFEELVDRYLQKDINVRASHRLTEDQKRSFLSECQSEMDALGYDT